MYVCIGKALCSATEIKVSPVDEPAQSTVPFSLYTFKKNLGYAGYRQATSHIFPCLKRAEAPSGPAVCDNEMGGGGF